MLILDTKTDFMIGSTETFHINGLPTKVTRTATHLILHHGDAAEDSRRILIVTESADGDRLTFWAAGEGDGDEPDAVVIVPTI